jgi:hypothetical protein
MGVHRQRDAIKDPHHLVDAVAEEKATIKGRDSSFVRGYERVAQEHHPWSRVGINGVSGHAEP